MHIFIYGRVNFLKGFPGGITGKEPAPVSARRSKDTQAQSFILERSPEKDIAQPILPVFLPTVSHGQRSLEGFGL